MKMVMMQVTRSKQFVCSPHIAVILAGRFLQQFTSESKKGRDSDQVSEIEIEKLTRDFRRDVSDVKLPRTAENHASFLLLPSS